MRKPKLPLSIRPHPPKQLAKPDEPYGDVTMSEIKHYDVGIVGWWSNLNYGGTTTYYALNKAIERLGYSSRACEKNSVKDENQGLL